MKLLERETSNKVSKSVVELITKNRQIYTLFFTNFDPKRPKRLIENDFVVSAEIRPVESLDLFLPQISQYISIFLQHIISNLSTLAKAIAAVPNFQDIEYFATIIIPAIFSYFSTEESLSNAFVFYGSLMVECPFKQFAIFLKPFFFAPTVSAFSDYLFKKVFMESFLKKIDNNSLIKKIQSVAIDALCYLPAAHLSMLKLLCNHFPSKISSYILTELLVVPHLIYHSQISPLFNSTKIQYDLKLIIELLRSSTFPAENISTIPLMNSIYYLPKSLTPTNIFIFRFVEILDIISLNLNFSPIITNAIMNIKTVNQQKPFLIRVFQATPTQFNVNYPNLFYDPTDFPKSDTQLLSNFDYFNLWKLIKKQARVKMVNPYEFVEQQKYTLPKSIDINQFLQYVKEKRLQKQTSRAEYFEQYLTIKYKEKCLKNLQSISDSYLNLVSMKSAFIEIRFKEKKIWPDLANLPSFGEIKFWYAIKAFDSIEPGIISSLNIKQLEKMFSNFLETMKPRQVLKSTVMNHAIWEASCMLTLVDCNSSFLKRFMVLVSYIEEIEKISKAFRLRNPKESIEKIAQISIITCDGNWILKTLLFFNVIAYNDDRFKHICSKQFIERWDAFILSFLKLIAEDEKMFSDFSRMMNLRIPCE